MGGASLHGCGGRCRPKADRAGQRTHILASNALAQAQGVQPALKRATAQALIPELELLEQDLRQEQQALESMALTCLQFTPSVSLQYEVSLEASLGLKPPTGTDPHPRPAGPAARTGSQPAAVRRP